MINHARTLLLNIDGSKRAHPTFFGEEFVEPTFKAVELDSTLINARRALFGSNPDRAGLNLMLWHYMRALDSTEFVEYVEALDPRITYRHDKNLLAEQYGVHVSANAGALDFTGTPGLGDQTGRLRASWTIKRVLPSSFVIMYAGGRQQRYDVTFTDGISEYVPLPGYSGLKVRFLLANMVNDTWAVSYLARPQHELDPINRLAQFNKLTDEVRSQLFSNKEPYSTFKQLFENHALLPYKLSGALLAVIYRTEERRLGT